MQTPLIKYTKFVPKDKPTNSDKVNAFAQGVFIVAQVANLGAVKFCNDSTIIISEVASAATDVTRTVTKKVAVKNAQEGGSSAECTWEDVFDVLGVVMFRVGACSSLISQCRPDLLPMGKESGEILSTVGNAIGEGSRKTVSQAVSCLARWYKNKTKKNSSGSTTNPNSTNTEFEKKKQEDILVQEMNRFIRDPLSFPYIPEHQQENSTLLYSCKITGKKIRYAMIPIGSDDPEICYEKSALVRWVSQNPKESPPHWPKKIPFQPANFVNSSVHQHQIDCALKNIAKELKGS